jgi:nucleoside-diphosphate-sugar epimerase
MNRTNKDGPLTKSIQIPSFAGGVGQLVTSKLASRSDFKVRATSRDVARGEETISNDAVQVVELDLVGGSSAQLQSALQDATAVVVSIGTTAFPTLKWRGGNTPEAIDKLAVQRIAQACPETVKKIVLVTSVGVDRTSEMPFKILNLFGVLDAKKAGEQAVIKAASDKGFSYAIIRPGRLIGGPFTNLDVAKLLQVEGGAENGLDISKGDSLLGDCKRDACAEAIVQCCINDSCSNVAFSISSNEKPALTNEQWTSTFQSM